MRAGQDIEFYLDTIVKEGLHSNKGNLQFRMDMLFRGIDFNDKTVLDIGGGAGILSFYASFRGAEKVLCLEPEAEGSSSKIIEQFRRLKGLLGRDNVELEPVTFQAFKPGGDTFDIILLHNSINHLDETACINLLKDDTSRTAYRKIFSKLSSLSKKGGKLILCDCSRHNFFNLLKIRNPFAPMIEWHKHQSPAVWASLLKEAGFVNPKVGWTSFNRLRYWGRVLMGNKLVAYFLASHFFLTMDKA